MIYSILKVFANTNRDMLFISIIIPKESYQQDRCDTVGMAHHQTIA